jgi:hypothetical protein
MAVINVSRIETLNQWREKTNDLSTLVGDGATLTTTSTDVVAALNEHDAELGDLSSLTTTATTIVAAINEHDSELGNLSNLNTTATTIVGAINEHESDIGDITALDTTATSLVTAINEIHGDYDTTTADFESRITTVETQNGTTALTTTATTVSGAINELDAEIGDLSTLVTTATDLVAAINEVHNSDDDRFDNVLKLDLEDDTINGDNEDVQEVLSKVKFSNDVEISSTFDIRNGTILIGSGGSLAIEGETFVNLGKGSNFTDGETYNAADGGLILNRGGVEDPAGTWTPRPDVRLTWDESEGHWFVKEYSDDATPVPVTSQLLTRYNAKDLIANNTESGISVTWDATNQNFDFNVADPTITISGDVAGSATMTNLGNVTISVAQQNNSVDLGTHTTGQYAAKITEGTGGGLTITTPNTDDGTNYVMEVDSSVVRTSGTQSINGEKTFVDTAVFSDDVTIAGDLVVQGTTTQVESTVTNLQDPVITIGFNPDENSGPLPTNNDAKDRGMEFFWHNGTAAKRGFFGYDNSSGKFAFYPDATNSSEVFAPRQGTTKGTLDATIEWADVLSKPTLDNYVKWIAKDHDGTTYDVTSSDTLQFKQGSGITVNFTADDELTITNSDKGSSQNIFKTVSATNLDPAPQEADWDQTGSVVADSNNDTLTFVEGSGIDIDVYPEGDAIRFVNTDRGSSQYIYKTVTVEQPNGTDIGSVTADNNNDTLFIREKQFNSTDGIELSVTNTSGADIIHIAHANTSSVANLSSNNSGRTFIQDISFTYDTYGHVTASSVTTGSVPTITWELEDGDGDVLTMAESKRIKYVQGSGISINWTDTDSGTAADPYDLSITNTDRGSSQNIFKNLATTNTDSGYTWADTGTAAAENNNDTFTFVDGGGVDLHIDTSGTNQALRIRHSDTSSQGSVNNSGGTVIQDITLDTYGHITGIGSLNGDARWVNVTGDTMTGNLQVNANINCTGDITSTSDRAVKENIRPIDNALALVQLMDGVRFERNDLEGNPTQVGVIAQDMERILPDVVATHEETGLKGVNYGNIVSVLIEAIKEQQQQIEELKARLV